MDNLKSEDQIEFFEVKCKEIDELLEEAISIREELYENSLQLEIIKKDMKVHGNRLDIYMNNIIDLDCKFDYKKHVIMIDNKDLCIYSYKDLKCLNFENTYESIANKKELFRKKLPTKQILKSLDLAEAQSNTYIEYESCLEYQEEILIDLKELIDEVKDILIEGEQEDNQQDGVEMFDSDIHEILLFEKNGEYDFIYIRKEKVEEFLNRLKK